MTVTLQLTDYLGRSLVNAVPGVSNATDYIGRAVVANTGDPTDDTDYLGRLLHGFPPAG